MYVNLGEMCYQPEGSLFFIIIIIIIIIINIISCVRVRMAVELLVMNVCK
jgi:hypothetical protein